jgi:hypothetical protein
MIAGGDESRELPAADRRKHFGGSLTDSEGGREPGTVRHKKVLINAIRSLRIWSKEVQEELCDGASEACFGGKAYKEGGFRPWNRRSVSGGVDRRIAGGYSAGVFANAGCRVGSRYTLAECGAV